MESQEFGLGSKTLVSAYVNLMVATKGKYILDNHKGFKIHHYRK
jgi:hypothetical protein